MPKPPLLGWSIVGHPVWLRVLEWLTGTTNNNAFGVPNLVVNNATDGEFAQSVSINIQYGSEKKFV